MDRGAIFTLPNSISMSRLLLALGFVLIDGRWERTTLIVVAATTDFLDGWLARRRNSSTIAGALIDPLADRVFVLAAVTTYLIAGMLTLPQFLVFLIRDIATAVGFVVARFIPGLSASSFQARTLGKAVTALQLGLLVAVLQFPVLVPPMIFLIGALSVVSAADYTLALNRVRVAARRGGPRT
ncbi:MAG: CDP-alcohol phosphatidyltransferase family protein [Gemmatimonadota bacterium]|nr:CDP-alcohol phosphatidyltransferase family protein [Gemmatimonadota bacterium]